MESHHALGESLLDAWITLSFTLWNERFMTDLTFNEACICNFLYHQASTAPEALLTATDLCQRTQLLKSQMNKILSEMEQKGYIRRERSEKDKRQFLIYLSDKGLSAYQKEHANISAILEQIIAVLGEEKALLTAKILTEASQAFQTVTKES